MNKNGFILVVTCLLGAFDLLCIRDVLGGYTHTMLQLAAGGFLLGVPASVVIALVVGIYDDMTSDKPYRKL